MGKVERYGLLALFALCALIVVVGIIGDEGTEPDWSPANEVSTVTGEPHDAGASTAEWTGASEVETSDRDRLEPAPPPMKERGLPPDAELWMAKPRVLEPENASARKANAASKTANQAKQSAAPKIRIRKGDSFERIAVRELGSRKHIAALMAANPGVDPKRLQPGKFLNRPDLKESGVRLHRVRRGDTLEGISKRFYGSKRWIDLIAKFNDMTRDAVLRVDRVLRIPPLPKKK